MHYGEREVYELRVEPPTRLLSDNSRWTHLLRIERDWRSPTRKEADLTFRVLLILRHQWQRQIRMLDRRDDVYPI